MRLFILVVWIVKQTLQKKEEKGEFTSSYTSSCDCAPLKILIGENLTLYTIFFSQ